jgi:hypothetical protein
MTKRVSYQLNLESCLLLLTKGTFLSQPRFFWLFVVDLKQLYVISNDEYYCFVLSTLEIYFFVLVLKNKKLLGRTLQILIVWSQKENICPQSYFDFQHFWISFGYAFVVVGGILEVNDGFLVWSLSIKKKKRSILQEFTIKNFILQSWCDSDIKSLQVRELVTEISIILKIKSFGH